MRKFWGELLLLLALFGIAISTEKASSTNMFQFPATPAATSTAQSCERGNDTGGIAISADGKFLLAIYSDSEARLWDFATGELLHHFLDPSHEFSTFVSFSPDNKYAVTSGVKGTILWDVQTGVKHHTFEGDLQDDRTIVSFSSDSEYLFTGGAQGIMMWAVHTCVPGSSFHVILA